MIRRVVSFPRALLLASCLAGSCWSLRLLHPPISVTRVRTTAWQR